jgi:hypothetical protein
MARFTRKNAAEETPKLSNEGAQGGSRLPSLKAFEDLEHLNDRIPSELMMQLRVHCARNRASLQSAVTEAIETMLTRSE